jgi:hypothetical protein
LPRNEALSVWSVSKTGIKSRLTSRELVVPIRARTQAQLSIRKWRANAFDIAVRVQNDHPQLNGLPTLSVIPLSGNLASVRIGNSPLRPIARPPPFTGQLDLARKDPLGFLSKRFSGDLAESKRCTTPDRGTLRSLVLQYRDVADLRIGIRKTPAAWLVVDVGVWDRAVPRSGKSSQGLSMSLSFSGSNVAVFRFRETRWSVP